MQANTNDRFLNIRVYFGLLKCVRKICIERLIEHLAIMDIEDVSQTWYRDFFRLAGFYRCRCQGLAGSTLQLGTRRCFSSRELLDKEFATVYKMVKTWLAEGRCTRTLLESIASGEAAEVESRYFLDLLAELESEKHSQSVQAHMASEARDQTRHQNSWPEYFGRSAAPRRKASFKALSSRKHWHSQESVVESRGGSASKVRKKRQRNRTTQNAFGIQERHKSSKVACSRCKSLLNTE